MREHLLSPRAPFVVILLSWGLVACGLVVSFDHDKDAPRRGVRGTVDGLEGSTVTLLVNGAHAVDVGNGPFEIPAAVTQGLSYSIAVRADPVGHACALEGAAGTGSDTDVSGVAVHCRATDTALSELSISAGPLMPLFDPSKPVAEYASGPIPASPVLGGPTAVVSARTRSPSARLTIGGLPAISGAPTKPILVKAPNPIDVTVTAANGSQAHTSLRVAVRTNDYLKASNSRANAYFGRAVAMSGDTIVVGATGENSGATGINGDQTNQSTQLAGAVYVFVRSGAVWSQQAYLKASPAQVQASFGYSVALSGDTLVVGAPFEEDGGGAYVFTRSAGAWSQQGYLRPSNARFGQAFGHAVTVSGDELAVAAIDEGSSASGVGGSQSNSSLPGAGAVYTFVRQAGVWSQRAYIKSFNTRANAKFGSALALNGDTLAVGAFGESSGAKGVDGDQSDESADEAGAVYVFTRSADSWARQAYLKASNTRAGALFGAALALSGNTLAVGSPDESSAAKGIGGDERSTSAKRAGAVYVFSRAGTTWSQQAYVKASNTEAGAVFGGSVALVGDVLAVGAGGEAGSAIGIDGDALRTDSPNAGAVYVFHRRGELWSPGAYVKASNTRTAAFFGCAVAVSGNNLVVGSYLESGAAAGINGPQAAGTSTSASGAAYVY